MVRGLVPRTPTVIRWEPSMFQCNVYERWALQQSQPSVHFNPTLWRCLPPSIALQWCVKQSEGLSARGTFWTSTIFWLTTSCTHSCLVSKCLTLPQPSRWTMPLHALLSVFITILLWMPIELKRFLTPKVSLTIFTTAFSSASALDNAMTVWVEDQWEIIWHPLMINPPDVDFRVFTHPAQSLSQ